MNLRDLHYLVALADCRNFNQAAQQCFVSQPTLSNQIKKLEEQLGVALFERTNKRVMITDIGELILAHARRILNEAQDIKALAQAARCPLSGPFRLGAFPSVSTYIFPKIVPKIKKALPEIQLILIEEKTQLLLEQLKQGKIDAALVALPIEDAHFSVQPLFDDVFYLAVPKQHPLAKQKLVRQDTLSNQPLLLLEEGHCLRDQALAVCEMRGAHEDNFRATGLETLRQMVKAGTGMTLMPEIAIQGKEKDICYLPFAKPQPKRTVGLVWRKTSPRTAVMDILTDLIKV